MRKNAAFQLDESERVEFAARKGSELLHRVLPDLAGLKERRAVHVQAAE